ncbi:cold-regulated protein 27-like [Zingiber officinale]|uniref:cold-regulated protein 27-like n=1 Tax=Zingiber officinale TaxID=94328 RepID=UPI001C4AF712|nr:cold-regulated protein 27-like [Zingiber officinale]
MRSSWGGIADRMGESSSNRPDTGETSKMESPSTDSQLVDSLSKGWTDEKHTLFLNSIESSFVNELHNGEYNSKAFYCGISRTNTHRGSCGQYEKNETDLKSGQFKVLYKESLVYNKGKKNAQLEIGSKTLSANPWIRHFRSPCVVTKRNSQFTQPSPHIASEGHYGEGTEVSDQNFMDDGPISEKRSSIIGGKRKLRAAMIHDSINDQLVPSRKPLIMPISDGNHTLLSTNSECSSQTSEVIPNSLLSDAKELLHDDDEVNS